MKKIYSKSKSLIDYFKQKNTLASGFYLSFGQRGSGKTTNQAKRYLKWLTDKAKGKNVHRHYYSNTLFNIADDNFYYLDLRQYQLTDYLERNELNIKYKCCTDPTKRGLEDTPFKILPDSIIDVDELGVLYHSRSFKDTPQELINFTKIIRKQHILLYTNSQAYDIDKALRTSANELFILKKFLWWTISRRIRKYITIATEKDSNGNADNQIMDKVEFYPILSKGAIQFTFIPFYTNLFNSFE